MDLGAPPAEQWTAGLLLKAIGGYQRVVSPWMPRLGVRCRFTPTCSHYGVGVIQKYGAVGGSWRAAWRVVRCGPWARPGTVDPP